MKICPGVRLLRQQTINLSLVISDLEDISILSKEGMEGSGIFYEMLQSSEYR